MLKRLAGTAAILAALAFIAPVQAAEIESYHQGAVEYRSEDREPVLKITVDGTSREINLVDIEKLPMKETTLETNWGAKGKWQGVLLADLLDAYGLGKKQTVHILAIDDTAVDVNVAEIRTEQAFLATRLDGKPIAPENRGPLVLLWPASADAALNGSASLENWITSVVEISAPE